MKIGDLVRVTKSPWNRGATGVILEPQSAGISAAATGCLILTNKGIVRISESNLEMIR